MGVEKFIVLRASVPNRNGGYRTRTQCFFFPSCIKEGEVRDHPTTVDRRREESGDRRVECSTWVWIRAAIQDLLRRCGLSAVPIYATPFRF